jgi:hypothetical protein
VALDLHGFGHASLLMDTGAALSGATTTMVSKWTHRQPLILAPDRSGT